MMEMRPRWIDVPGQCRLGILLLLFLCVAAWADDAKPTLTPVEGWCAVFGGHDTTWHFTADGLGGKKAHVSWVLASSERTVARGDVDLATPDGKPPVATVPVTLPPVKPGALLGLTLKVTLLDDANAVLADYTKPLWLFPPEIFVQQTEWLKGLNLRLYDPDGATAKRLDALEIPYKAVGNLEAFTDGDPGVIIIGEGLSFTDYRGLSDAITKAATAGFPVLCLAPNGGTLPLPGSDGVEGAAPTHLSLRRAAIITEIDKHLDATAWPNGPSMLSGLTLRTEREQVVAEAKAGQAGWPWLECTYPTPNGTLILCGFGLIAAWDDGPTPRHLFARLLHRLGDSLHPNEIKN